MLPGMLSLIFFIIELVFLVIILKRNNQHPSFLPICFIMALLQIYQLSEFMICIGIDPNITGRIAFVSITFLPPTGHVLTSKTVNWKYRDYFVWFGFGLGFALFFIFTPDAVELVSCNPFYAVYEYKMAALYGWYYMGNIFWSLILILHFIIKNSNIHQNLASALILLGYLACLLPVGIMIYLVDPKFGNAVPSIMCKYAIVLAIILFFYSFRFERK